MPSKKKRSSSHGAVDNSRGIKRQDKGAVDQPSKKRRRKDSSNSNSSADRKNKNSKPNTNVNNKWIDYRFCLVGQYIMICDPCL